jgi:hypothetical protein
MQLRLTSAHANGKMRTKKTAVDHDGFLKLMLAALRLFLVLPPAPRHGRRLVLSSWLSPLRGYRSSFIAH